MNIEMLSELTGKDLKECEFFLYILTAEFKKFFYNVGLNLDGVSKFELQKIIEDILPSVLERQKNVSEYCKNNLV